MRAKLIIANWLLSFGGLCVDIDTAPVWVVVLLVVWFGSACVLLGYADRKGWMESVMEKLH